MNKSVGVILAICQHVCTALAIIVTGYLLYRWNMAREANPGESDLFNPWWAGVILMALGTVFRLARKGLSASDESRR